MGRNFFRFWLHSLSVTVVDGVERPQCILCSKVFSNFSLKPSKLQEHFINKHGGKESEGQDPETLKKKKAGFDNKGALLNLMKSHSTLDSNCFCCDRKSRAACAQSFAPWQQALIEITRRDHYYCLFAPHTCIFVLRAHPVRGESHNQRNTTGEVATLHASYRVAYRIAKSKKPHTVAESLIKPCAMDMVKIVMGDELKRNCNKFLYQIM